MRFIEQFELMQEEVHQIAIDHGWWEGEVNEAEKIALMHSELSEALEALRKGNPKDEHCPHFSNGEVELADVIIRIMDLAEHKNYNIAAAIVAKSNYNKTREYKHGKKLF